MKLYKKLKEVLGDKLNISDKKISEKKYKKLENKLKSKRKVLKSSYKEIKEEIKKNKDNRYYLEDVLEELKIEIITIDKLLKKIEKKAKK